MSRAVHREAPTADKSINRRLAFGVFATPVAWFLHEIIGVSIVGRNCQPAQGIGGGDIAAWQWTLLVIVPIAAAATALAGVIVAFRVFRKEDPGAKITRVEGWNRVQFVAVFGALLSSFLLLNIIYFGVMPFVVEPCVRII